MGQEWSEDTGRRAGEGVPAASRTELVWSSSDKASDEETIGILPSV